MFKTPLLQLSLFTVSSLCATSEISLAQVTIDNTVNTQVEQNGNVAEITGGETRGGNLFHSFQDFSVPTGNEAFFNNANDISNILSRVTGGNVSNIDGLIRANGNASLFLINPAGIVFGQNASLNIGGSFYGSTASSILFEGGEFSAADLENPPLLTVNAPIGLGFRDNPGDIVNNSVANDGRGLEVTPGSNLSLLGGDVNFNGGIVTAPGGRVDLGGLSATGIIMIEPDNSFSFPEDIAKGNVSLNQQALVAVRDAGGGFINVNASNFSLSEESILLGGIESGQGSPEAQAGDITINVESLFLAEDNSQIITATEGVGDAGNIFVNATTIEFTDDLVNDDQASVLIASTLGQGDGGDIEINANNISFDGSAGGAVTNVGLTANDESIPNVVGDAGDITVNTDSLFLSNGAGLSAITGGVGDAGDITVNAKETVRADQRGDAITRVSEFFGVTIRRPSGFKSFVRGEFGEGETSGTGDAGTVAINAQDIFFTGGGGILTITIGQGNAGDIIINATGSVELDDAGEILSQVIFEQGNGNAGNITINADKLSLNDESQILSDTQRIGNSGNIAINANEVSLTEGSFIISGVGILGEEVEGDAGNIEIDTGKLFLDNISSIVAETNGAGNAGDVIIQANEYIILDDGSAITSDLDEGGSGTAGNINLTTPLLNLKNGSRLSTSTFEQGEGTAGSINVNAAEQIDISDGSRIQAITGNDSSGGNINVKTKALNLFNDGEISTLTEGLGNAGNIELQIVEDITLEQDSFISARAFQSADGGNLTINSRFITAFPSNGNGNDIIAIAEQGNGGNITINAESLFGISEGVAVAGNGTNDIDASSQFNLDGNVTIDTPDINPIQGATELPSNIVVPEQTTAQACQANRELAAKNGFTIKGKGGVPPAPDLAMDSQNIYINGEDANSLSSIPSAIATSDGKIQPARGIKVTEDGGIVLTAYRTNNSGERLPAIKRNCDR